MIFVHLYMTHFFILIPDLFTYNLFKFVALQIYSLLFQTGDVMLIYGGFDEGVKPYRGMWRFNFG